MQGLQALGNGGSILSKSTINAFAPMAHLGVQLFKLSIHMLYKTSNLVNQAVMVSNPHIEPVFN